MAGAFLPIGSPQFDSSRQASEISDSDTDSLDSMFCEPDLFEDVLEVQDDTSAPHPAGIKRKLDTERSHYALLAAWVRYKATFTRTLCWEGSYGQQRVVRAEMSNGTKYSL